MDIVVVEGIEPLSLLIVGGAVLLAYAYYLAFMIRSLTGLQVAFPTGPKRYEVHTVTANRTEAIELLKTKGMRNGIITYMMALAGAILLGLEFLLYQMNISKGLHLSSMAIALILIALPAIISSSSSLTAQVLKAPSTTRATLQDSSHFRNSAGFTITLFWFVAVFIIGMILSLAGIKWNNQLALMGLLAFAPSMIAYGRILGSSWTALKESSKLLSQGKPSAFYPHKPGARKQFISYLVHLNTSVMPFIAFNTVISLLLLAINPDMFQHSSQVLELPEYRPQSTIMEEGGVLGFYAIELFSNISEAGIRVPLVTMVLLFLLLNVAIVGFVFVNEVARILFLDIADISGKGGIHLVDSRLMRSERSQQAKVLNFCFTGFAGQSMLLLALAMLTFWDSTYLPQGAECGSWENTVCTYLQKDSLEALTWMLAAGGQVVFLVIWMISRRTGQHLADITFDATADLNRTALQNLEGLIYRQEKPFTNMIANDSWSKAIYRMEKLYEEHGEESMEGMQLMRRTEASMELLAGIGRWDQAEQVAVSLLALKAGRKAEIARLILTAASLAQRDILEATPRLELLTPEDVETARLFWISSVIEPKMKIPPEFDAILSIDPITKRNIDLIKRWNKGEVTTNLTWIDDPAGRLFVLGDIARFRSWGQSTIALDQLEAWIDAKNIDLDSWPHGQVAKALLYLDKGMEASAIKIIAKAIVEHPRHPHIRRLAIYLAGKEGIEMPIPEPTGLIWADTMEGEWEDNWVESHNVIPAPQIENKRMKAHAWAANAWSVRQKMSTLDPRKKGWKKLEWENPPLANHLITTGLITTVGGMPIDLGFPGWIKEDY